MSKTTTVTTVHVSKEEFRQMIEEIIEEKLAEALGDPDEGLPIRKSIRDRLLRQQAAFDEGEPGIPLEEVAKEFGL